MMQPSDNELDQLIKEAGDNYHPSGATPDWAQMHALLDKDIPATKGSVGKGLILLTLLFVIVLVGGTYIYFSNSKGNEPVVVKEPHATDKPAIQVSPGTGSAATENTKVAPGLQKRSPLLQNNHNQTRQQKKEAASKRYASLHQEPAGKIRSATHGGEAGENGLPVTAGEITASAASPENVNTPVANEAGIQPITENSTPVVTNTLPEKKVSPEEILPGNKIPADPKIITSDKKNKNNGKRKRPLEFSLVYAPELTTIGFSYIDKPGSNYGLLVGYPVAKNLILQTGIIKSKKNYIADGKDYDLGYPQSPSHKLSKVDGYCMMYEIPLNVKSNIRSRKKINLFYSAGISSYFMTSEFYTYHYTTSTGSYDKSVTYRSQKNYWWSVASAGLGIEKEITPALHVAAMPFVKIPFKGMGAGNLKLLGTGINFLLTYKPSLSK